MHDFINFNLKHYSSLHQTPGDVLAFLFATNGTGYKLNNKGYLNENYRSTKIYPFGEPQPLSHIYPWSCTEEFQPFRKFAGCRDVGFKEAARYFIECIAATPDTVEYIADWKANIVTVTEVLLDTPTLADEYEDIETGYEQFLTKLAEAPITDHHGGKTENPRPSVYKTWYFDVQWSTCPKFVEKEVKQIWLDYELGNDNYMYKATLDEELFANYPNVYYWLKNQGVAEKEQVIVHWWW